MRIGDERLLKLANRLLEIQVYEEIPNNRALDVWDFMRVNYLNNKGEKCGCALGEAKILFPSWNSSPFLGSATKKFFQITEVQRFHLFVPNHQFDGNENLGIDASPEEVAYNIIDFVQGRHLKGVL